MDEFITMESRDLFCLWFLCGLLLGSIISAVLTVAVIKHNA